jgi:hypothetical protein
MRHNFHFALTNHAIGNLRQYAPPSDLLPMDDEMLRLKLDDKLREAEALEQVYQTTDKNDGSAARAIMLGKEAFGVEVTAFLKPDAYQPGKEAVVTIFPTSQQAARARQAPAPPPPVAPPDPNARLVSYQAKSRTAYEQVDRSALKDKIASLVRASVDAATIRVWKPVELKVSRRVEVDVDLGGE